MSRCLPTCLLTGIRRFNETMQESLVTIVEIKTRQHAQDMNTSLFNVQVPTVTHQ